MSNVDFTQVREINYNLEKAVMFIHTYDNKTYRKNIVVRDLHRVIRAFKNNDLWREKATAFFNITPSVPVPTYEVMGKPMSPQLMGEGTPEWDVYHEDLEELFEKDITPVEFEEQIKDGNAQVLTLDRAQELIGKRIAWMYYGDRANYLSVQKTTVGSIVSEYDYNAEHRPDRNIPAEMALREKETLCIIDKKGNNTFMRCETNMRKSVFSEPTFYCSDEDRKVYFFVLK